MRARRPSRLLRLVCWIFAAPLVFGVLVLSNEALFAKKNVPHYGELADAPLPPRLPAGGTRDVTIMAYNIAKGFVDAERPWIPRVAETTARLDAVAAVIRAQAPDMVFLSEVVWETPWRSVNQVRHLAAACGFRYYAFGENTNLGLPFFRFVGGNAILSRWPLYNGANPDLAGRGPFWQTKNNRRMLVADADIHQSRVRCASIHFDSFNPGNNAAQMRQLLSLYDGWPMLAAGDFNAMPAGESLHLLRDAGIFTGTLAGPATYPSHRPERRIDYIFAPPGWKELRHATVGGDASDHLAVVSVFRFSAPGVLWVRATGTDPALY